MKSILKIAVDIAMFAAFVYLMSYRAGRGLMLHGRIGIALIVLFVLHNLLNAYWHRQLRSGRYTPMRRFTTALNALLTADVILIAASSLFMAGDIFESVPFYTTQSVRNIHVLGSAWGLILMLLHLGLHTEPWLTAAMQRPLPAIPGLCRAALFWAILAAGLAAFYESNLWKDMLLIGKGNERFSLAEYYGEHVLIAAAACIVSFLAITALRRRQRRMREARKRSQS